MITHFIIIMAGAGTGTLCTQKELSEQTGVEDTLASPVHLSSRSAHLQEVELKLPSIEAESSLIELPHSRSLAHSHARTPFLLLVSHFKKISPSCF